MTTPPSARSAPRPWWGAGRSVGLALLLLSVVAAFSPYHQPPEQAAASAGASSGLVSNLTLVMLVCELFLLVRRPR